MIFTELTEDNFLLFAIKNYENPQAVTKEDFDKDLNHFKYIKRLLKRYKNTGQLNTHLLLNHFIILYNIFGEAIINYIASTTSCYIASTEGIKSGWSASAGVATVFTVSQSPTFAVQDGRWSVRNTDANTYTAGVSTGGATQAYDTQYETGVGWVGVQTYIDSGRNLRVKKEILVSMSGIATGNAPIYDSNPTA